MSTVYVRRLWIHVRRIIWYGEKAAGSELAYLLVTGLVFWGWGLDVGW